MRVCDGFSVFYRKLSIIASAHTFKLKIIRFAVLYRILFLPDFISKKRPNGVIISVSHSTCQENGYATLTNSAKKDQQLSEKSDIDWFKTNRNQHTMTLFPAHSNNFFGLIFVKCNADLLCL